MGFKYKELEKQLETACSEVHKTFHKKFNSDMYISAGGSKLESFINDMQKEFEATAANFIASYKLEKDVEAKKRVFAITKLYAKKCIDDFSRV